MAFGLLVSVYFQPNINCLFGFCRSKKPGLKVPPYHFVDHKLDLLSHKTEGDLEEFEQKETAQAHLSNIA